MKEFAVFHSISDIAREDWLALGGAGYSHWGWLKTVEESRIADVTPRLIAVYNGGKIVALAPCYIQRGELLYTVGERFISGKAKNMLQNFGISMEPGLYCYTPLTNKTRVLSGGKILDNGTLRIICEAMEQVCIEEKIDFLGFPYVSGFDNTLCSFLEQQPFLSLRFLPNAYLDIAWPNFEGYLAWIKSRSKNTYKSIHRELNRNQKAGIQINIEDRFGINGETFARLASNLFGKYSKRNRHMPRNFFASLEANMKANVMVITARRRERPIGFALFIKGDSEWNFFVSGYDYAEIEGTMTYFNIVFYHPIRLSVRNGARRINYGISNYTPKLRRGCRLEPIHIFIRCRSPIKKVFFLPAASLSRRRMRKSGMIEIHNP